MTRRPADLPVEAWHGSLAAAAERLERAWLRLFCAAIAKPYRRNFLWMAGWGPVGAVLFLTAGGLIRLFEAVERGRLNHP